MAIAFVCECGKVLRARDELAGKRTRCPQCSAILTIPSPEVDPDPIEPEPAQVSSPYQVEVPPRLGPPAMTFRPTPSARPSVSKAEGSAKVGKEAGSGGTSLLEYSYLLLVFALVPLIFSLLGKEGDHNIAERLARSIDKASPEEQKRIEGVLARGQVSDTDLFSVLPGGKLDGAHLARDSMRHWVYAAIAGVAFLLFLGLFFSVERANPLHLLGVGVFTGTVGIVFLLLVQFCSNFRLRTFRGGGVVVVIMLILTFIGWSYESATDPGSNFFLSALGFTFGVGLCEEVTKAIPLFFYFKRDARMGWRGACLWGLASGIGFGVSEGIMYSSRHYNGIGGADIYLVRFVSCVALHAMWSASVGIAIARNSEAYDGVEDAVGFGLFMLRMVAVPMVLHGLYDTLLKMNMNVWALVVALLSFGWFCWHIELARRSQPDEGRPRASKKRKLAY